MFEIENDWWKNSEIKDYKYPVLNDQLIFYENYLLNKWYKQMKDSYIESEISNSTNWTTYWRRLIANS